MTPSEYNKSTHNEVFLDVMQLLGFGRRNMSEKVIKFKGTLEKCAELDFSYDWVKGQPESVSYVPLMKHLTDHGLNVISIADEKDLPDDLLYYEVLYNLKTFLMIFYTMRCYTI